MTVAPWWVRLSGAELRARLTQRGLPAGRVELLVRGRDHPYQAERITELLGAAE